MHWFLAKARVKKTNNWGMRASAGLMRMYELQKAYGVSP